MRTRRHPVGGGEGDRERQGVGDDQEVVLGTLEQARAARGCSGRDLLAALAAARRREAGGGAVGPAAILLERAALETP